jgi:acetyltransferase-like isoleucine patch superfamily enzyme
MLNRLLGRGRLFFAVRAAVMAFRRRRLGLRHVHRTFYACAGSDISSDLVAGPYSFMREGCSIGAGVRLGRYAMVGRGVSIVGGEHVIDRPGVPVVYAGWGPVPVTAIGDDAFVGEGSIVIRGVSIGDGAIIGAGAVVTHDVPPFEVWAGVPARRVGLRFVDEAQQAVHLRMLKGPLLDPYACPFESAFGPRRDRPR